MNLKYMKVSLFEISYKKKLFHNILIYWDAPVELNNKDSQWPKVLLIICMCFYTLHTEKTPVICNTILVKILLI